jgi:hypothetical protein
VRNTAHIRNLSTVLASDGSGAAAGAEDEPLAPAAWRCRSGSRSWAMARGRPEEEEGKMEGWRRERIWGRASLLAPTSGARPRRFYTAMVPGAGDAVRDGDELARRARRGTARRGCQCHYQVVAAAASLSRVAQ